MPPCLICCFLIPGSDTKIPNHANQLFDLGFVRFYRLKKRCSRFAIFGTQLIEIGFMLFQ